MNSLLATFLFAVTCQVTIGCTGVDSDCELPECPSGMQWNAELGYCSKTEETTDGDREGNCSAGNEECECYGNSTCNNGLVCSEEEICETCVENEIICDNICVDPEADREHCGACWSDCPNDLPFCCGGQCVDIGSDPGNCGYCEKTCNPDETCAAGHCQLKAIGKFCNDLTQNGQNFQLCLYVGETELKASTDRCSDCKELPIGNNIQVRVTNCENSWYTDATLGSIDTGEEWLFWSILENGFPSFDSGLLLEGYDCETVDPFEESQ